MRKGKIMVNIKDSRLQTVEQVVCSNTGMTPPQLLNDITEYQIDGLDVAAWMIKDAIKKKKTIYIPGDYDVDGVLASGILEMSVSALGGNVIVRLPKRFSEGYGLRASMIDEFEPEHLIITVDNGITSIDAIKKAKEKGMTVIVTDHHLAAVDEVTKEPIYPDADLIIDPNAIPHSADFNGYCGAGLAYKLSIELLGKRHPLVPKLLSLAAIATIADSVPLIGENRRIVKEGLKTLITKEGTTKGIYALLTALELDKYVSAENIGYKIAPALNAPGRLRNDGAMDAYRLVTFDGSYLQARDLADKIIRDNTTRRELSDFWTDQVIQSIGNQGFSYDFPIVAYIPNMPEGIIGIIAGRIAEKYQSPCFLLSDISDPELIKGSGRSYGDVHLKELLDKNQAFILKYGGHAPAAGLTLKRSQLDGFREALQNTLCGHPPVAIDLNSCDLKISPREINSTMKEILKFQPYGEGNPSPVIFIDELTLIPNGSAYYRLISNGKGVKLTSSDIEIVSFQGAEDYAKLNNPRHVRVLGTMSQNHFMGYIKNQLECRQVFPCNPVVVKSALALTLERKAQQRYTD